MDTLQITKDAAIRAHENAKNSGKELLENLFGKKTFQKDIKERIKIFDDVLNELNFDKQKFMADCMKDTKDEAAYKKLKEIAKALNEGWIPDWENTSQTKYYPWFKMGSPSGVGFSFYDCDCDYSDSDVGSRLCFKSRELAEYAGKTFTEIYKDFLTLNK